MGFCTPEERQHFLWECSQLEPVIERAGIHLIKFFFHISKEEQEKRFKSRQTSPLKVGKMSAVDLASQNLWGAYAAAYDSLTLSQGDWVKINSNNKTNARMAAMQYVLLNNDYLGKDLDAIGEIDKSILTI